MDDLDDVVETYLIEIEERLAATRLVRLDPSHRKLPLMQRAVESVRVVDVRGRVMARGKALL